MITWITKSRLRTALVMVVFVGMGMFSLNRILFPEKKVNYSVQQSATISHGDSSSKTPDADTFPDSSKPTNTENPAIPENPPIVATELETQSSSPLTIATGIVSSLGTISTLVFAWRTDRRGAKESNLKVLQMQQQIIELQRKLDAPQEPKAIDNAPV